MVSVNDFRELYFSSANKQVKEMCAMLNTLPHETFESHITQELRRYSHMLKSKSLLIGFDFVGEAFRSLENYFTAIVDAKTPISFESMKTILFAMDEIKLNMAELENNAKVQNNLSQVVKTMHNLTKKIHT